MQNRKTISGMKAVILAGGLGTRLSEATHRIPKPMVEIGGMPILWHIMKLYSSFGVSDFVVLLGYKGLLIKQFFANYFLHRSSIEIDLQQNSIQTLDSKAEPWRVTLLETGQNTMTGGRLKIAQPYLKDAPFFLTYGDGVADINIRELWEFHQSKSKLLTMTSIQPEGRFGIVESQSDGLVTAFKEKPRGDGHSINGGFFVCESEIFNFIPSDTSCVFEQEPLRLLAEHEQIVAYRHPGFWQCMDTLRDHTVLNELWDSGKAPWKSWNE
jgi:glucose-1-phosphate cytidylyltransferase